MPCLVPQPEKTISEFSNFTWTSPKLEPLPGEDATTCQSRTRHLHFEDGQYRNLYTKTTPSMLHCNGYTKTPPIVDPILAELTRARRARLGRAAFLREGDMVWETRVHLGNGSTPAFGDICPGYDLNRGQDYI